MNERLDYARAQHDTREQVEHTVVDPRDARRQSVDGRLGFATWKAWLDNAGADIDIKRGLRINNSAAVLQAAIDGQGVALARSVLARDDVAAGRLVRLFPEIEFASALAYYIVYRPECALLPKLAAFRDWLAAQTKG